MNKSLKDQLAASPIGAAAPQAIVGIDVRADCLPSNSEGVKPACTAGKIQDNNPSTVNSTIPVSTATNGNQENIKSAPHPVGGKNTPWGRGGAGGARKPPPRGKKENLPGVRKDAPKLAASSDATKKKPVVHKKQRNKGKSQTADKLVAAFNEESAKIAGQEDALKETRKIVEESDLHHLSAQIDKLATENAKLSSLIPRGTQETAPTQSFDIKWTESKDVEYLPAPFRSVFWLCLLSWILIYIDGDLKYTFDFEFYGLPCAVLLCACAMQCLVLLVCLWVVPWRCWHMLWNVVLSLVPFFVLNFGALTSLYYHRAVVCVLNNPMDGVYFYVSLIVGLVLWWFIPSYTKLRKTVKRLHCHSVCPMQRDSKYDSDLRPEVMKKGKLVFLDPRKAFVTYKRTSVLELVYSYSDSRHVVSEELSSRVKATFQISMEVLSQLTHLAVAMPTDDRSVAYERLKFGAKNIVNVNVDRYEFASGEQTLVATTAIAIALYEQTCEKMGSLSFYGVPAPKN